MSDAIANYELTKKNTPIPAGWMLVEPHATDPRTVPVQFWNRNDQCWLELSLDANGAPSQEFAQLWMEGATCCIVRDPNYVAPPPPPTFSTPFATPFAAPMAPAFAAPVAPPTPELPPVPAPVIAAPVLAPIPQAAPVIPVAIPAPVAPAVPTLPPILALAPVVPVVAPVAPAPTNILPFPVAAPGAPVTVEEEEVAQASAADPNEVAAWLAARDGVKAQLEKLEEVEKELRAKIVKTCFPDGLREGSNKCSLPDGRTLTITGVVNRTMDDAMIDAALEAMKKHFGIAPAGLFRTKYEVGVKVFKGLDGEAKKLLSNVITEKNGSPQLKVSEPKA